ncbi:multiple C2 and transmembrane domain-containing protein-like isoform X5 [Centruroides vittatus]|uniref:multiple C2 and transmembrane domain-containing protein-like isoform X5 n=1 Tax=Centruroides vittatus TaxID=120091 RepID=UPI00350FA92A
MENINLFSCLGDKNRTSEGEDLDPVGDPGGVKGPKSKTKSQSDLSDSSDMDTGSRPSTPHSRTVPSSPNKKILSFKSSKKMHSVWSTLKRLAPNKMRSRSKERHKNNLHSIGRLSSSHPDVSCSNLAALAKGTCDDSALPIDNEDLVDAPSFSDPTIPDQIAHEDRLCPSRNLPTKETENLTDSGITIDSMNSALSRQKFGALRQHAFFQLDIHLRAGKDLLAKDACGTSDPYVKFKIGGRQLYKSRTIPKTLEPFWDEFFHLPVEDVFQPLLIRVYDYDFGLSDDFMGAAEFDLTKLELNKTTDVTLYLTESGKSDDDKSCGYLMLAFTLIPKTQEEKEQYFNKSSRLGSSLDSAIKKQKTQVWDSVVTIVLVEGKNLLPMDENGLSDPYVKFRLGTEKYKSKNANKTLNPQWLEQFDLHMYAEHPKILEVSVWDRDYHGKDDFMGRCTIDLSSLTPEKTHNIWQELEDGAGSIYLLITISGMHKPDTVSDLTTYEFDPKERQFLINKYNIFKTFNNLGDVGHLVIKVFKAQGLASADIGGKSDPFCVVELVNARLQTHTEYKTLTPEWNKIFVFQVKDIHSVIEITVYDEDRDKRCEFLGKVAIPLLKVKNGEKRWFALKDKKLKARAKGQILLEMDIIYNPIRASVRTFNPKEMKYMQQDQKFKRAIFMRNVNRVKMMVMDFVEIAKFLNSCFQWESTVRSVIAFVVFLVITYTFELYMLPIALLLIFFKNYIIFAITGFTTGARDDDEFAEEDEEDDDDDRDSKSNKKPEEEKKSLKEKLQAVQEVTAMIQNILGEIASMGERCKNTFNFTVSFLSWLAIFVLISVTTVLYFVPLRYLVMAWGINKFTKKLRNPNAIPNNELLDFLSRVPDNEEKIEYRDLKPSVSLVTETERKRRRKAN